MSREDRIATQMQELGRAPVIGESLATLVRACNDVGLDPEHVLVSGVVRVPADIIDAPRQPGFTTLATPQSPSAEEPQCPT